MKKIKQKIIVFDSLRDAMRIALPDQNKGLNDDGIDSDMNTIKAKVIKFRNGICNNEAFQKNQDDYIKMIKQIDKYWEKLFADPILVDTPTGKVLIQPQRTNNILERFFRDIRRRNRRKNGVNSLNRTLKAILADTPLIKNLENKDYMNILNGKENLENRFAEIEAKVVREELNKTKEKVDMICPEIKSLIRKPELPRTLTNLYKLYAKN